MKQGLILITCFCLSLTVFCQNKEDKSSTDSTVITGTDFGVISKKAVQGKYALLHIYRPKSKKRSFASFTINVNDTPVCKIKSNTRYSIKIYKFGTTEIWARSESKSSLTLNIEMGKEYYLKCNVKQDFWAESPRLEMKETAKGKEEFDDAEEGDYD